MATTVPIPLTTLTPGTHVFGPSGVADNVVSALLSIDRTVANGFNSQPGTVSTAFSVEQSNDGGTTWVLVVGGTMTGGLVPNVPPPRGPGGNAAVSTVQADFRPGTGRQARSTVTTSGGSVAVQGSLTLT